MSKDKNIFIIDGSSYIFRAYFAFPFLSNSAGQPTNAIYGFLKMLKNTLHHYEPSHIVIALDSREETFRKKLYPDYKANREEMPEDLSAQIPYIDELINALNIPLARMPGVEADDVIATLAKSANSKDFRVTIISGDKDLMQLVNNDTVVIDTMKNKRYDIDGVIEKFGVKPEYITDLLAIMGDSSDNIPGVKGIGIKGAAKLINEYGKLEDIYLKIESIKNQKHKQALIDSKDVAKLSKRLVELKEDVDIDFAEDEFKLKQPDKDKLLKILTEMEFISELREWNITVPKNIKIKEGDIKTVDELTVEYRGCLIGYDLQARFSFDKLSKYKTLFDTKLASYVLRPGKRDYPIDDISIKTTGNSFNTNNLPGIRDKLDIELKDKNLSKIYYEIDLPCIMVLKNMQETGCLVDIKKLVLLSTSFGKSIEEFTDKIYSVAGMTFNINSPKQLSYVLFEKLNLPTSKKTETGFSTDQEVLSELSALHPLPALIMEYRELVKLKSTYVEPLLEEAQNGDGRIRTTYHLDVTSTGRLSSSKPNLQNIPIRTPLGTKIREVFIAPKNKKLISADYSQIELIIFAHLSKDPLMTECFNKGEDIHLRTASEIFDVSLELITPSQRRQAKAINFGLMYGKTAFGLAKELGIPQSIASKIIKRYFERYEAVARLREELIEKVRQTGFSETIFGRRRYIPDINHKNTIKRNFAERNALNSPIQGTASDIMKIAMIKLWNKLNKEYPASKIILHVHDELLIEVPENLSNKVVKLVKHEMENAVSLSPKLVIDTNIASNWLEAHGN